MFSLKKPYLIIPKLIEQPTWGGEYILKMKRWEGMGFLKGKKIGQSYELFSQTKVLTDIHDTNDPRFIPELGTADSDEIVEEHFTLDEEEDFIFLTNLMNGKEMPLLIKINQAAGNSFQLHIKQDVQHPQWKPKAESWYYLENGMLTFGIKKGIDVLQYKQACDAINNKMKELSDSIKNNALTLDDAKRQAKEFIQQVNPWQYVNVHEVNKYDCIDLSLGGLHHSWEENKEKYPLGNVLYEVQQDVMDPVSTIRSFDQGKIKDDGSIRMLQIDDYFQYLDTDPAHNDIQNAHQQRSDKRLLTTPYYSMDILEVPLHLTDYTHHSFCHLFVRDGDVDIITKEGRVHVGAGHSCFLPAEVGKYEIQARVANSVLLKTFISSK